MSGVAAAELAAHAFVRGMPAGHVARLAEEATVVRVPAGDRIFEEGQRAGRFWLVRAGLVALDLHVPGREPLIVETISDGELVGLSWLSPPFQWQYGARAMTPTDAFELDGAAVIGLCDRDPAFGYELVRRLMTVASRRLHASRIRMLDLYGAPGRLAGPP